MENLTEHEVKSTDADGEETVETFSDAEEAANAAAQLERQGNTVEVRTIYDDGEPAATSAHTGGRPDEPEPGAVAEKAAPKGKADK